MRIIFHQSRTILCAGVSLAALAAACPVRADDMHAWTKAPVSDRGEWRGFVEGGVFWTGGDPIPYQGGFAPFGGLFFLGPSMQSDGSSIGGSSGLGAVPVVRPGLGWDVAAGADYRFAGT